MSNGELSESKIKPIPDPTVLTTEQLLREVDRAVTLLQAEAMGDRSTNEVRFRGVEREFTLIEDRRKEQKVDTKTAVDAALSAADKAFRDQTSTTEKSVLKSETAAAEQSRQQYATFTASLNGVSNTLADVKERVGKIEAGKIGAMENKVDTRQQATQSNSLVFGVIGAALGIIAIIITLATLMQNGP